MQALENTALRSWVKTYPLRPTARMNETVVGERAIATWKSNQERPR